MATAPAVPTTPTERWQQQTCTEYAQWLSDIRGLAPATITDCCAEATRFLDWLGTRGTLDGLGTLALANVDAYVQERVRSVRRRTRLSLAARIRGFLRWLHHAGHLVCVWRLQ